MSAIKPKCHKVTDPNGRTHLAYAPTRQGAITKVQNHVNDPKAWSAELATSEDLILAGRNGTPIIDAPDSLAVAELDAEPGPPDDQQPLL